MNKEEALEIICMVAEGLNPYIDKEPFKNPPEKNPTTIRALCIAVSSLLARKDREYLSSKYHRRKIKDTIQSVNGPLKEYLREKEKEEICRSFYNADYSLTKAATFLGMTDKELKNWIVEYDLTPVLLAEKFFYENNGSSLNLHQFISNLEEDIFREAIFKSNFDRQKTTELLGISYDSVKFNLYTIDIDFKSELPKTNYLEDFKFKFLSDFTNSVEKEIIIKALKINNFKKPKTAEMLGISLRSLNYRIDIHAIES